MIYMVTSCHLTNYRRPQSPFNSSMHGGTQRSQGILTWALKKIMKHKCFFLFFFFLRHWTFYTIYIYIHESIIIANCLSAVMISWFIHFYLAICWTRHLRHGAQFRPRDSYRDARAGLRESSWLGDHSHCLPSMDMFPESWRCSADISGYLWISFKATLEHDKENGCPWGLGGGCLPPFHVAWWYDLIQKKYLCFDMVPWVRDLEVSETGGYPHIILN